MRFLRVLPFLLLTQVPVARAQATADTTRFFLSYQGSWSSSRSYVANDVVTDASGSSFVAVTKTTNQPPDTNPSVWLPLGSTASNPSGTSNRMALFGSTGALGSSSITTDGFSLHGVADLAFSGTLDGNTAYTQSAAQILAAQGGGLVSSQGSTFTTSYDGTGLVLSYDYSHGESTSNALQINSTSRTPGQQIGQSTVLNCYSLGDCITGDTYINAIGGAGQSAQEGTHPGWNHVVEGTGNPLLFCQGGGCVPGATTIQVGGGPGQSQTGAQQWIADLTHATSTTVAAGGNAADLNLPIASFPGQNFTPAVFVRLASGLGFPNPTAASPGTQTVAIDTTVSGGFLQASTAHLTNGMACLASPQTNSSIGDWFELVPVTVVDATHVAITSVFTRAAGAVLAQGNGCGVGSDMVAETNATGTLQIYHMMGAVDGTHLLYSEWKTPFLGTQGGFSHYTGTNNAARIFPIAMVTWNHYGESSPNVDLSPNAIQFSSGLQLTVAAGNYPFYTGSADLIDQTTNGPLQHFGHSVQLSHYGARNVLDRGYLATNINPITDYDGSQGYQFSKPDAAFASIGVFSYGVHIDGSYTGTGLYLDQIPKGTTRTLLLDNWGDALQVVIDGNGVGSFQASRPYNWPGFSASPTASRLYNTVITGGLTIQNDPNDPNPALTGNVPTNILGLTEAQLNFGVEDLAGTTTPGTYGAAGQLNYYLNNNENGESADFSIGSANNFISTDKSLYAFLHATSFGHGPDGGYQASQICVSINRFDGNGNPYPCTAPGAVLLPNILAGSFNGTSITSSSSAARSVLLGGATTSATPDVSTVIGGTGNAHVLELLANNGTARNTFTLAAVVGGTPTALFEIGSGLEQNATRSFYLYDYAQGYVPLYTSATAKNVGINNTTPSYTLDVGGDLHAAAGSGLVLNDTANGHVYRVVTTNGALALTQLQ